MAGYRNLPEQDRRGARRRRLAAHRRHRDDRRGRLRPDRRPQEGDHHQRGRQEHVAGEHRGDAEGRLAADRPGVRDRRRAALQHRADRARRRLRARLGGAAGHRGRDARRSWRATSAMRAAVQEGVDDANAKLARVEQIKKFTLVEGDWLPGGDELTPTMKLKRKPIAREVRRRDRGDVRRLTPSGRRPHRNGRAEGRPAEARSGLELSAAEPPPEPPSRRAPGSRRGRSLRSGSCWTGVVAGAGPDPSPSLAPAAAPRRGRTARRLRAPRECRASHPDLLPVVDDAQACGAPSDLRKPGL